MYIPSNKYIGASKRTSRNPKSKIIIDGVEYTGMDIIKTHPSISHDAQKMIGEFPIKECKFVIFNREDNIDVVNKDISVFRGLVLEDGSTEYIPQGIFNPKQADIKTNSTDKTIEITMKDKSVLFDQKYDGNLEYPTTLYDFVNEIVTRHGLELETTTFPFHDMILNERPNFDLETTPERLLIAQAGELGGCNTQISRTGGVIITKPYSTGITLNRINYKKLSSKEKQFGSINAVVLGNNNINNDIVFRDEKNIAEHGLFEWKILDNPYVDKIKKEMIDKVAEQIIGMSIIPFEIQDTIDSYLYDLNDVITIEDKFGNLFNTTILSLESTSRIFTKIKAPIQNVNVTNYNLAGSSKKAISQIKLDVDHVKNEMLIVAKTVNNQNEKISEMKFDVDSITTKVTNDIYTKEEINGNYTTKTETSEIKQTVDKISSVVEVGGGLNMQQNSVGLYGLDGIEIIENRFKFKKISSLILGEKYTLTFKISNEVNNNVKILLLNVQEEEILNTSEEKGLSEIVYTFIAKDTSVQLIIELENKFDTLSGKITQLIGKTVSEAGFILTDNVTNRSFLISDTIFRKSLVRNDWEQANGEILGTVLSIYYNGIEITSPNAEIKTKINNMGFVVINNYNQIMLSVTKDFILLTTTKIDGDLYVKTTYLKEININNDRHLIIGGVS